MKAMLFAAGLGTRLKPFTDHHPKALAEVNGKTLLELNIKYLQRHGIYDVLVNVHHFADQIEDTVAEHDGWGSNITISDERKEVLETGGGLKKAAWYFEGEKDLVIMNVDVLTNLDLQKMIAAHAEGNAIGTLAVMKRDSSRQLLFDNEMNLCGWENNANGQQKISRDVQVMHAFAFSGVQVLSHKAIAQFTFEGKFGLIDHYLQLAKTEILKGYDHSGNVFIDVGKPESLEKAAYLFE